jgi:hypothetical protein
MALIEKENYRQIDSEGKSKIVFYFSFGSKDMRQVRKWSQKLNGNLTGMQFKNLDWRFTIFEGKDHYNSGMVALFHGLSDLK